MFSSSARDGFRHRDSDRKPRRPIRRHSCALHPPLEHLPVTLTDMAAAIKAEHLAARKAGEAFIEHAVNVGKLLIKAKAKFPHGRWLPWVEANCEISERQCQNYMRLARNLPQLPHSKTKRIADLSLAKALEQLGHKSRPPMKVRSANAASSPADDEAEAKVSEIVELRPELVISQAINRPDDPEPEVFFKEDDEALRRARNIWRIRYQELIGATLTLEDANWALEMLQWRIRNGHRS